MPSVLASWSHRCTVETRLATAPRQQRRGGKYRGRHPACGGAAGCYDLGFIITQIIYRIGEKEFASMVKKLNKEETNSIEGLIMAGLEYGDNDKDGKMDDKRIENEFPELQKLLKSK
jgi:hypothetical protein